MLALLTVPDCPSRPWGSWHRRTTCRWLRHLPSPRWLWCSCGRPSRRWGTSPLPHALDEGQEHLARELGIVVHHKHMWETGSEGESHIVNDHCCIRHCCCHSRAHGHCIYPARQRFTWIWKIWKPAAVIGSRMIPSHPQSNESKAEPAPQQQCSSSSWWLRIGNHSPCWHLQQT